jgi:DNA polymerase I-like protein with 3'-5' exonuclease and polymerase domains
MQLPFYDLIPGNAHASWTPTPVSRLPSWKGSGAKRVSFDLEAYDPDLFELGCGARRRDSYVCGISFKLDGDRAYYLPTRHKDGGNLDETAVWDYVRTQMWEFQGEVLGGQNDFDMDWCQQYGVKYNPAIRHIDVLTTDSLIWEHHNKYDLDSVAERRGFEGKKEKLLRDAAKAYGIHPKSGLALMHSRYVGWYAEQDVVLPEQIRDSQLKELDRDELHEADQLESDVLPITVQMRRQGILIDQDQFEQTKAWAVGAQQARLTAAGALAGRQLNRKDINSAGAISTIIKTLGLPDLPLTDKGKPSIKGEALQHYTHPVMELIKEARRFEKLLTTYIPETERCMVNGRLHATLKSARATRDDGKGQGTISRRFSCVTPNLQNQPNPEKDQRLLTVEIGMRWRRCFIPELGTRWALVDFSQQEPRWIVHHAECLHLAGYECYESAVKMAEAFRNDVTTDNHDMVAALTGLARNLAKIIFLARCYGAGYAKIADQLKLYGAITGELAARVKAHGSPDGHIEKKIYTKRSYVPPGRCVGEEYRDAVPPIKELIERFDTYAPYVKKLARFCTERAEKRHYIKLPDGGRLHFEMMGPMILEGHTALNKLAQGSAAIQAKKSLVLLHRAGLTPQLSVHDDFSRSITDISEGRRMQEICRHAVKANVPFVVKLKVGDSWGTADNEKAAA